MKEQHKSADAPRVKQVFVGVGNALKHMTPEHQGKGILALYDHLYYSTLTDEEKKVKGKLRPIIEKNTAAIGWAATGVEAATLIAIVAMGLKKFRSTRASEMNAAIKDGVIPQPKFMRPDGEFLTEVRQGLMRTHNEFKSEDIELMLHMAFGQRPTAKVAGAIDEALRERSSLNDAHLEGAFIEHVYTIYNKLPILRRSIDKDLAVLHEANFPGFEHIIMEQWKCMPESLATTVIDALSKHVDLAAAKQLWELLHPYREEAYTFESFASPLHWSSMWNGLIWGVFERFVHMPRSAEERSALLNQPDMSEAWYTFFQSFRIDDPTHIAQHILDDICIKGARELGDSFLNKSVLEKLIG